MCCVRAAEGSGRESEAGNEWSVLGALPLYLEEQAQSVPALQQESAEGHSDLYGVPQDL